MIHCRRSWTFLIIVSILIATIQSSPFYDINSELMIGHGVVIKMKSLVEESPFNMKFISDGSIDETYSGIICFADSYTDFLDNCTSIDHNNGWVRYLT